MFSLFRIPVRDHSAMLLMTELAHKYTHKTHETLREIAERMQLSEGYLEEIVVCLKTAGLIVGRPGPGGGYRLAKSPHKICLEDILIALEGPLELVDCQVSGVICPVASKCHSKNIWKAVQESLQATLRKTRLADVLT